MSDLFYVRLDDRRDVRRTLLETSKASIHCLRAYQDLVRVRGEKMAAMQRARMDLRELTTLLNRLERLLPALSDAQLGALRPATEPALPALPQRKPTKSVAKKASGKAPKRSATSTARPSASLSDRLARIEQTLDAI